MKAHALTLIFLGLVAGVPIAAAAQPTATPVGSPSGAAGSGAAGEASAVPATAASTTSPAASALRSQPPPPLDRSTPRQTVAGFIQCVEREQLSLAAQHLDLRGLRWHEQTPEEAVRGLHAALTQRAGIRLEAISDVPEGNADDGADAERIAAIDVAGRELPVTLERIRIGNSNEWLFSRATVARIPELTVASAELHWLARALPSSLQTARFVGLWAWQWLGLLLSFGLGYPVGHLVGAWIVAGLRRLARRTPNRWDDAVVANVQRPLRFLAGWSTCGLMAISMQLPGSVADVVEVVALVPVVVAVGWAIMRAIRGITDVYLQDLPDDREMKTRGLRTQIVLLRKISTVALALITLSIVFMQFDAVRDVGWSMLASAGVAGVALGIAAQKSLGAVVAGLQITITQPMRLGDAIIIQGQWGEVEEIALTYVRVKLWDERRLVVPIEKFLTEAFENWSKPGTEMIGIVELAVDPTMPIEVLRAEVERLAAEHPGHDGRECLLQVIDSNEHRTLVRARISTSDVSQAFTMRCEIRERLVAFVQQLERGRYLPRHRWQPLAGTDESLPREIGAPAS